MDSPGYPNNPGIVDRDDLQWAGSAKSANQ